MSRSGEVTLPFGSEEYVFRLGIGSWRAIQEKCDAGPPEIARRLGLMIRSSSGQLSMIERVAMGGMGQWRVDDVREPIYQGLIGGGMTPNDAGALVRTVIDGRPMADGVVIAFQVVMASLMGTEDEEASGEPKGEVSHPSPEASSALGPTASTPSARSRGSRRAKSTP